MKETFTYEVLETTGQLYHEGARFGAPLQGPSLSHDSLIFFLHFFFYPLTSGVEWNNVCSLYLILQSVSLIVVVLVVVVPRP